MDPDDRGPRRHAVIRRLVHIQLQRHRRPIKPGRATVLEVAGQGVVAEHLVAVPEWRRAARPDNLPRNARRGDASRRDDRDREDDEFSAGEAESWAKPPTADHK